MSAIRGDLSDTLRPCLDAHIDQAVELLGQAELAEERGELARWRSRRASWRGETALTLARGFEREAIAEFLYASARAPGLAHASAQGERRSLENAIELLRALHSSLGARGTRASLRAGAGSARALIGEPEGVAHHAGTP